MQTVDFQLLPPEAPALMHRHLTMHQLAMHPMAGGDQAADPSSGATPIDQEASLRTEANFDNAATGAAQAGEVIPPNA